MKCFIDSPAISYDDICLVPQYSDLNSRSDADISVDNYRTPIINSPMIHTSSKNMLAFFVDNNMCPTVHRYFQSAIFQFEHVKDALGADFKHVFFAVGKDTNWIKQLHNAGVTKYLVDMAHGDSKVCIDTIKYIKDINNEAIIMAGNIATSEGYSRLRKTGADYIRIGIAGGSICSTAKTTAFGVPMISSIMDCIDAKTELGGILIADGGIRSAADILKAIAVGADMVMCGKLLASTNMAAGPFYSKQHLIIDDSELPNFDGASPAYVEYAGMASTEMRMRNGSHDVGSNISIEGVAGMIKYTGETNEVVNVIIANLKAGLAYSGSRDFVEFEKNAVVRTMSAAGVIEKETHLDING